MKDSDLSKHQVGMEHWSCAGLFQRTDAASLKAQRNYLLPQRVHLGTRVPGGTSGAFAVLRTDATGKWLYGAIAFIVALGLCINQSPHE